jgi:hypothetical protein
MFYSCSCPCLLFFFFLASLSSQNVWGNRDLSKVIQIRRERGLWKMTNMLFSRSSSCVYSLFAEYPGTSRRHASWANENTHTHIHTMQPPHPEMKKSIVFCADKRTTTTIPSDLRQRKHIRKLLRHSSSSSSAGLCSNRYHERTVANSNSHMFKRWENLPQNSINLCRLRTSCLQRIFTVFLFFSGTSSKENLQWRWALADHHSLLKGFVSLVETWVGCSSQHPRDRDRR